MGALAAGLLTFIVIILIIIIIIMIIRIRIRIGIRMIRIRIRIKIRIRNENTNNSNNNIAYDEAGWRRRLPCTDIKLSGQARRGRGGRAPPAQSDDRFGCMRGYVPGSREYIRI